MSAPTQDGDLPAPAPRRPNVIHATWAGEHRFDTERGDGSPSTRLDGSAVTGQSPVDALLSSLAACSGIDVVDIMAKRRTPLARLAIEVQGSRRSEMPRRIEHLLVTYDLEGAGIERVHAERAVQLAFEKYCSVAASLAPDMQVETVVIVNGDRGAPIGQVIWAPGSV